MRVHLKQTQDKKTFEKGTFAVFIHECEEGQTRSWQRQK